MDRWCSFPPASASALALIRALALHSPVLLLDEADRRAGRGQHGPAWRMCCANVSPTGVTIAMVTHSAAQAARLGHRHLRMENRRLVPA